MTGRRRDGAGPAGGTPALRNPAAISRAKRRLHRREAQPPKAGLRYILYFPRSSVSSCSNHFFTFSS
jgi:hypothetical protein